METFLREIAGKIISTEKDLASLTIVFPNRRAALYFKKHLSELITQPVFSPTLITIEDFIGSFSSLRVPDKLELINRLHVVYKAVMSDLPSARNESFDQFYFWGDMLLRDFDEVDKYLVSAAGLFKDLTNLKEIESGFDYLTDQQKEFLLEFWKSFGENITDSKKKFIEIWNRLYSLYKAYKESLQTSGWAYDGMLHREVAEMLRSQTQINRQPQQFIFVGFNALTKAEEIILSKFADFGSKFFWDGDEYYVNNAQQEAGVFFREYQEQVSLKKTFPDSFPANLRMHKQVKVYGAAQPSGQVKLMAQILNDELHKGLKPEETLIVLPDEKLLMPVLYAIPHGVAKLNVTMGFSLSNTPFFNFIELLVELQRGRRKEHFNHRAVMNLLAHPYVVAAGPAEATAKRKEILKHNWINIPKNFLCADVPLHRLIFKSYEEGFLNYTSTVIKEIGGLDSISDVDKEFAFQFIKIINRMVNVMGEVQDCEVEQEKERQKSLKSFIRLFRQLVRLQRVPFSGEPLRGLQVMGVLETRNLDYKNVFILSLNEGVFPSFGGKGSYIPFNVRRAYGLPTVVHQDAMYAYLFYRSIQRAENVHLFYNTETDDLGQGEMSRYLKQLLFESGLSISRHILHNSIQPTPLEPIVIRKSKEVMETIHQLNVGQAGYRGISPSAINAYIECRLKFYFRHVAKIREPKEVDEDIDARVLGNFLHKLMEKFYKEIEQRKKSKQVEPHDFAGVNDFISRAIDQLFIVNYRLNPNEKVEYEGQRLIVRNIVSRFASIILKRDAERAPFMMEAVEAEGFLHNLKIDHAPGYVVISGKIDRIDRKENEVRVIDYKTGGDKLEVESIESLFNRDGNRNKAAFQTLLYALLYRSNRNTTGLRVIPGLINRKYVFDKDAFGFRLKQGDIIEASAAVMTDFETHLKSLLEEIFDPSMVFDQTEDHDTCKFCPYSNICYR